MKDKTKRILAYIALVFIAVFTVTFVVFLITRGNVEAFVTLFSGVAGLVLFFIIKAFDKKSQPSEAIDGEDDGEEEPPQEEAAEDDTEAAVQESADESAENGSQETADESGEANA